MDSDIGKIFVGGISWETTEEKLKEHFGGYGEVVEVAIMKDRATGRARGFGFVVFADPTVIDAVLQESHTIEGRVVECKKAVPRDEQQNFPRHNSSASVPGGLSRTKKIFVGGLASTVTEEDFRNYFAQFGVITDVVVMYDHTTQRPRGFGFITFESEDSVERVVQKPFHELHNKTVEVKKAVPKELSAGAGGRANQGYSQGFGGGRGTAPLNAGYGPMNSTSPGNSAYGGARYAPPPGGRGGFPSYGPPTFGPPSYGAAPGYGMAMNGAYAAGPYAVASGYAPAGGFAAGYGDPAMAGYGGAAGYGAAGSPSPGYVSAPVAPRSPWGSAVSGFAGNASPAAYGAGAVPAAGMAGYGTPGWTSGGAGGQMTGTVAGYNGGGYGYGTADPNYSANAAAGQPARNPTGVPASYGEAYANSTPYGESAWRSGESHNSPAAASGAGAVANYGMGAGGPGMVTDAAGYGVAGRQARGPDARFRPYPAATERAA